VSRNTPWAAIAIAGHLLGLSSLAAQSLEETREDLFGIERASHQQWLVSDRAALARLMGRDFHFVAMNGAVETRADVVGEAGGPARAARPLQVSRLEVEPERFALSGNVAVVVSRMEIEATVQGRPIPQRMTVLSVFQRDESARGWTLLARSITPILAPPRP
jgi:hypothetical protein